MTKKQDILWRGIWLGAILGTCVTRIFVMIVHGI